MKKKFPYLEVRGSHRDIGHTVGETFRGRILEKVLWRKENIPGYKDLRRTSQNYFLETLHFFPKYIEELTATAVAANVGIMDLLFMNTRSLYDPTPTIDEDKYVSHDRCTTVVSFNENGPIVGHNEDWDKDNIDDLYILKCSIGDTKFIGVNYINELPGTSASMNNWGLVQGVNELHQVESVGIPKNFIARAILECKSLDQADGLLRRVKQDSGFNHVLVQGKEVRNVEIGGGKVDVIRQTGKPLVHTNHFLGKLKKYEVYHSKSSIPRYEKAVSLVKDNMNEKDMINLLSDHSNTEFPICRHEATLGTLIFEPTKGEVKICYGPPCNGKFDKYTL